MPCYAATLSMGIEHVFQTKALLNFKQLYYKLNHLFFRGFLNILFALRLHGLSLEYIK